MKPNKIPMGRRRPPMPPEGAGAVTPSLWGGPVEEVVSPVLGMGTVEAEGRAAPSWSEVMVNMVFLA